MKSQRVALGDVLRRVEGFERVQPTTVYQFAGTYSYARGVFVAARKLGAEFRLTEVQRVHSGQFVYCKIMAWEGAFGVVPPEADGCVLSGAFVVYDIDCTRLDPRYLAYYFQLPAVWQAIGCASTGTNVRRRSLHPVQFEKTPLSFPPLEEQRRIVARVEELAGKVQTAVTLRKAATAEATAFMQSMRNGVILGYQANCPQTSVGQICTTITDGPHVSPAYVESGVPFISVRNISEFGIDFSTAKYVSPEDHAIYSKKAKVEQGDVLYTKGGTTGVARRVDTDRPFSIWVHVALLKLNRERACAAFVEHALNSPVCKEQALRFTHGSSNKDLGLTRMCNIVLPLPPLPEQEAAARRLDDLHERLSRTIAAQQEADVELRALLPSILDKAFKGEL